MIPKTIILALILCALATTGEAPDKIPLPFIVYIEVESEKYQNVIKNYLVHEFRKLRDVEIVGDDERCEKQEFNLSVFHTYNAESHFFSVVLIKRISELAWADPFDHGLYRDAGTKDYHGLFVFQPSIREGCENIVREIDIDAFESERQFARGMVRRLIEKRRDLSK